MTLETACSIGFLLLADVLADLNVVASSARPRDSSLWPFNVAAWDR